MQIILNKLRLQRNILLAVLILMLTSNTVLVLILSSQKIITRLVPTIENEQIISSKFVNDAALKARAVEIVYLLFSMKKENVQLVTGLLLRNVDNLSYDTFKSQIEALAADIKVRGYRYRFDDNQQYEFENHKFTVIVKGYLETYLGGKQIANNYKEYIISFTNNAGRLTLKSFEEIKNAKHK